MEIMSRLQKSFRERGRNVKRELEETDGLAHGRFEVERFDVLPVLFEEGDKEVDAYQEVSQVEKGN